MATIKASILAHKGHFTREERFLLDVAAGDNVDKTFLYNLISNLQQRIATIAELYDDLKREDEKLAEDQESVLEDLMKRLSAAGRIISSKNQNISNTRPRQFRVASDLKPPILTLEATPPEMRVWITQFRAYHAASNMDLLQLEEQRAYFLARIEGELLTTMTGRIKEHTITECFGLLEHRFLELFPLFGRRLAWKQCKKKQSQKLIDYYHQLRAIGDEAELGNMTVDEHHMFELIFACRHDTDLFLKLLELQNPNLETVLSTATAFEAAQGMREQANPSAASVAVVSHQEACDRCGRTGHLRSRCPLREMVCHECGKSGHLARVCRQRSNSRERFTYRERPRERDLSYDRAKVRDGSRDSHRGRDRIRRAPTPNHRDRGDRSPSSAFIPAVTNTVMSRSTPTIVLNCKFDTGKVHSVTAIPDTGATRTVIPASMVPPEITPKPSNAKLIAANGTEIVNNGSTSVAMSAPGGPVAQISVVISPDLVGPMLVSWHDLIALEIIPSDFPNPVHGGSVIQGVVEDECQDLDTIEKIKADYSDVLVDSLGEASGTIQGPKMTIELDKSVSLKPCKVTTARPIPVHLKPLADELTRELISAKVMVPCTEPTDWTSPAHFVEKPGGKKARLVTDYRILNKVVKRPLHPFSSAHDLMKQVRPESRWFAKLDAVHGYFQVPLDYESSLLTAFLLPSGKWRYTVAPMGLNSSSDEFNIRTDAAVEGLEWLLKIVDDMLVQAPSKMELFRRLRIVLDRCRAAGIRLSLSKLAIGQSMKFAGFIVSPEGVKPDPSKVASIRHFPTPDLAHSTKEMRELPQLSLHLIQIFELNC